MRSGLDSLRPPARSRVALLGASRLRFCAVGQYAQIGARLNNTAVALSRSSKSDQNVLKIVESASLQRLDSPELLPTLIPARSWRALACAATCFAVVRVVPIEALPRWRQIVSREQHARRQ